MTRDTNTKATPEIRDLQSVEVESVTGGTLNCAPIIGDDGKMYSPTLDRIFGPFSKVMFPIVRLF